MKKITASLTSILGVFVPLLAKAKCTVNGKDVPCDEFFADFGWVFLAIGAFVFALIGFWLWMLIHAIKNNIPNKILWIVLLLFPSINGLAAIVYYFMIKRKFDGGEMQNQMLTPISDFAQPVSNVQQNPAGQSGGFCSACGASITPEMAFCGKCGNKLK
jgi:hypothetical protein